VADFFEHDNEPSDSLKGGGLLTSFSGRPMLHEISAPKVIFVIATYRKSVR
jgi:hypothetical protein